MYAFEQHYYFCHLIPTFICLSVLLLHTVLVAWEVLLPCVNEHLHSTRTNASHCITNTLIPIICLQSPLLYNTCKMWCLLQYILSMSVFSIWTDTSWCSSSLANNSLQSTSCDQCCWSKFAYLLLNSFSGNMFVECLLALVHRIN